MMERKIFLGFINEECKEMKIRKEFFLRTNACMNMDVNMKMQHDENAPNVQLYPSPSLNISIFSMLGEGGTTYCEGGGG